MNPLVSIIIPVYNTERHLEKCLDSIRSQTYSALEILLIDDGSKDTSGIICDQYSEADSRIKVYHVNNVGQSAARNIALQYVKGEYVAFCDSDDYIELDMIEKMITAAQSQQADIVVCGYVREEENGRELKKYSPKTSGRCCLNGKETAVEVLKDISFFSFLWDKLFRTEIIENFRLPVGKIFEDVATVFELVSKANRVAIVHDTLYHYVEHDVSTIKVFTKKRYADQLDAYDAQMAVAKIRFPEAISWILYHRGCVYMRYSDFLRKNCDQDYKETYRKAIADLKPVLGFILKNSEIDQRSKIKLLLFLFAKPLYDLAQRG